MEFCHFWHSSHSILPCLLTKLPLHTIPQQWFQNLLLPPSLSPHYIPSVNLHVCVCTHTRVFCEENNIYILFLSFIDTFFTSFKAQCTQPVSVRYGAIKITITIMLHHLLSFLFWNPISSNDDMSLLHLCVTPKPDFHVVYVYKCVWGDLCTYMGRGAQIDIHYYDYYW